MTRCAVQSIIAPSRKIAFPLHHATISTHMSTSWPRRRWVVYHLFAEFDNKKDEGEPAVMCCKGDMPLPFAGKLLDLLYMLKKCSIHNNFQLQYMDKTKKILWKYLL